MNGLDLNFAALIVAILIEIPTDEALGRFDLVPPKYVPVKGFGRSQDDQVVKLYLAGLSYDRISAQTGVGRDTAYHTIKRLRAAGMDLPQRCPRKAAPV